MKSLTQQGKKRTFSIQCRKSFLIVSIYKMRGVDLRDSPPFELETSFKKHFVALVELN